MTTCAALLIWRAHIVTALGENRDNKPGHKPDLRNWKKNHPALKKQMQVALQKVAAAKGLSKDVQEVVVRALG